MGAGPRRRDRSGRQGAAPRRRQGENALETSTGAAAVHRPRVRSPRRALRTERSRAEVRTTREDPPAAAITAACRIAPSIPTLQRSAAGDSCPHGAPSLEQNPPRALRPPLPQPRNPQGTPAPPPSPPSPAHRSALRRLRALNAAGRSRTEPPAPLSAAPVGGGGRMEGGWGERSALSTASSSRPEEAEQQ